MPDYSAMSDDDLNVLIAKRAGYKIAGDWYKWLLYLPSGERSIDIDGEVNATTNCNEDIAWYRLSPRFATDMNSAMKLWTGYATLENTRDNKFFRCVMGLGDNNFGESESAPRAICIAWLKWQDARNAGD